MKSKYIKWGLVGLLILLSALSCKSAPPPAEEIPPPAQVEEVIPTPPPPPPPPPVTDRDNLPPDQATLNALDAAAARAAAARKLVMDFDGPAFFPPEWQSADLLYTQAEQQKRTNTLRETRDSITRYNTAADALEPLSDRTLARYYDKMLSDLISARNEAVRAGAEQIIPDYLLEVDNITVDAQRKYQAKDYYGAKDVANTALAMYGAQKAGLDAYNKRELVADRVEALAPELLWEADDVGLAAIDRYLYTKDYKGATDGAKLAQSMYEVLGAGLEAYDARIPVADRVEALAPDLLWAADDVGYEAVDKYFARDVKGAMDGAKLAQSMYGVLAVGLEAYDKRIPVADRVEALAPELLWAADDVGLDAVDKYFARDVRGAANDARVAQSMYEVLAVGLEAYDKRVPVAARVEVLAPELLWAADDVGLDAVDKYFARNAQGAINDARVAQSMYEVLVVGLAAYDKRVPVADRVEALAPELLWAADDVGLDAVDKYFARNVQGAANDARTAQSMYEVLAVGLVAYDARIPVADRIEALAPELLWAADDVGLDAVDKYFVKDFRGAMNGAETAKSMYEVLGIGLDAYKMRDPVADRVEALAPELLWAADDVVFEAIDKYYARDLRGAVNDINTAESMYVVLGVGLETYDARVPVAARVEALAPELLWAADDVGYDAVDKYFARDSRGAINDAETAKAMYGVLVVGLDVYRTREPVAARVEALMPELLWAADDVGFEAVDKYFAKDAKGAIDTAKVAQSMYVVLGEGLNAYQVREEITNRGFEVYDPNNFQLADDSMYSAGDSFYARNSAGASGKISEAFSLYTLALRTAWESYAAEKGADAATERQKGLELKANVAVRQEFDSAQIVYNRGNTAFQARRFEEAADLYIDSFSLFEVINVVTREKQRIAEDALIRANLKMVESEETARAAELILEGGVQ